MSQEIYYADATELAERIRSRAISPVDVMKAHLERIEAINSKLNAIVLLLADEAMERARQAESAIMQGESWGPLHGVPFTVKDCVDNEGVRTTRGSKLFADYIPTADATVVTRLKDAGGIVIGKTNMPEFALWWETDNLVYGRTENPWMNGRTPGGSKRGRGGCHSLRNVSPGHRQRRGRLHPRARQLLWNSGPQGYTTGEFPSPGTGLTLCFDSCTWDRWHAPFETQSLPSD